MGWRSRGLNPVRVILALMSSPLRLIYLIAVGVGPSMSARSPHIVVIIADDMGWNDVSFHGSDEIPTPNIDALAYNGIILNKHYVQPLCSPSRAAFLTGMYPIHLGMQGLPFYGPEARGLPADQPILPQYLRRLGYSTHGIGKWHLGYATKNLLPTKRGFDSFLGYYNGYISYYDHIHEFTKEGVTMSGHDFRRNESSAWDLQGRYATDVFTEEAESIIHGHDPRTPLFLYLAHLAVHAGNEGKLLEAPQEDINLFRHITDPNRRTYAAMMHRLDKSVGRVTQALDAKGMLADSIILFMSDNGAPTTGVFRNWGSNFPFRGIKETLWEGGVRGAAMIWIPKMYNAPRVSNNLIHVSDWLPTLYTAAGGHIYDLPRTLDGINQWDSLLRTIYSPSRREILVNIDEVSKTAAIIQGPFKLVVGSYYGASHDDYYGRSTSKPKPYSYDLVSQSLAARAIASTSIKTGRLTPPPVGKDQMQRLRRMATVNCYDLPDDGPNPTQNGTVNCLYDLENDPCERRNLLAISPRYEYNEKILKQALKSYFVETVRQGPLKIDLVGADPKRFNDAWSPWLHIEGGSGIDKPISAPRPSKKPSQGIAPDVSNEYDDDTNTTDPGVLLDSSDSDFEKSFESE